MRLPIIAALISIIITAPVFAESMVGARPKGIFAGFEREMKKDTEYFNRFYFGKKTQFDVGDHILKNKITFDFSDKTGQHEIERTEVDFAVKSKTGVEMYVKNRLDDQFDWQRSIVGVEVEF